MNVEKKYIQNAAEANKRQTESAVPSTVQVDSLANELQATLSANSPSPQLPKIISFSALARCGDEIWIENNGQIYRLRRTKQDKLILTK